MSAAPTLWIISELYFPELTSTGYYITAIAEHLASEADVRVICGQPNYSARGERSARTESRNGVSITRLSGLRLDKNVLIFRVLNMLSLSASVFAAQLFRFKQGDRVLVVTTPPLLPAVTALAALVKGAGYTLLVHDAYPEQLYATGILRKPSIVGRIIDVANRWVYKHASSMIAVGRDMQDLLQAKTEGLDIPVLYIPNWGDTHEIRPEPRERNKLIKDLGFEKTFVVLCAGNFGRPSDLETIVAAAELLLPNDRIRFLFIGDGAKEKWLKEQAAILTNIDVLSPMPRSEQQIFLNACDVAIAPLVKGMLGAAVPSRIYNYLAAGKPIVGICEPDSEIARLVDEEEVGLWVEPGDAVGLADRITKLADAPDRLAAMSTKARMVAIQKFSSNKLLPLYSKALFGSR